MELMWLTLSIISEYTVKHWRSRRSNMCTLFPLELLSYTSMVTTVWSPDRACSLQLSPALQCWRALASLPSRPKPTEPQGQINRRWLFHQPPHCSGRKTRTQRNEETCHARIHERVQTRTLVLPTKSFDDFYVINKAVFWAQRQVKMENGDLQGPRV